MRSDKQRLSDILERIDRVLLHSGHIDPRDPSDPWTTDALIRNLEVIGEAARELSPALRKSHPDVPWKEMIGFRVFATHVYWQLDPEQLGRIVRGLPELRQRVARIRADSS